MLLLCSVMLKRGIKMTLAQKTKCNLIIHTTSTLAAGIGASLAQLPCSDSLAIVPLQITMIISLGAVFGIRLNQSTATATLGSATATMLGKSISQVLIGWLPIVGNVFNALTATVITETIGWTAANDFACRINNSYKSTKKSNCK